LESYKDILNSKSIGLALSGGGSKGLAHAGVLQFLDEKHQTKAISGQVLVALWAYILGESPKKFLAFKSIYFSHWRHFTFKSWTYRLLNHSKPTSPVC
jgi:NTE family protein